jgi:DNA polymerase I-like protein with 3'-5' exonuclease and polymerase domains
MADLPSWEGAKRVGFDVETKDPDLKLLGPGVRRAGSYVVGYSFAIEDGPSHYVPLRHEGGDNVEDVNAAWLYLRDQAKNFTGTTVGMNLQYDLDWGFEHGIEWPKVKHIRDIMVADPLINELYLRYDMETICERWGLPGKEETVLRDAAREYNVDPKTGLWKLAARFVGAYGAIDSVRPLQVLRKQEKEIEDQDLWEVFDLESDVLPVLVRMRRRGVRVDVDKLQEIERWSLLQEAEALAKVKHHSGHTVEVGDVWKADALAPAFEAVGVTVPTSTVETKKQGTKSRYNIDKDWLHSVDHPVAESIAWARKVNKLRTTFAASIRTHMVNGRIHTSFNQLRKTKEDGETRGAAYGRLSCENPNMQQQPSRDEFAKMWRSIYRPEEDAIWASDDFSQQEPRMLVHFAETCQMAKAFEAAERYRTDPTTDAHTMMAELAFGTAKKRKPAKELYLGKCYGMGGMKLCRKLGLPTRWAVFYGYGTEPRYFEKGQDAIECAASSEGRAFQVAGVEGQAIIDEFDENLPYVKAMAKLAERRAKKNGYIRTLSGRRCRFPKEGDGSYGWTYRALNRLIQGSSADQTKKALVDGDAAGHFIQLQVHDEIDGSFESVKQAEDLAEIMSNVYPLRVPFKVDVETGSSWGDSMGD